jgi:nicotinate phosphoribosyltransferase
MHNFVTRENMALLTDLYQLTMCAAYFEEGRDEQASFELFVRNMPPHRSYLIAAGLESALDYLENVRFSPEALAYLEEQKQFSAAFLDYLANFKFTGDLHAVPEGTIVFPNEPLLRVTAPIVQAQFVETYLLNALNFQTLVASKAARIVLAAQGRSVVDFSLRRTHGTDAGMKVARASYLAGCAGTSNVLAGMTYGIPIYGTIAHSYVMFHDSEQKAFEAYARIFPNNCVLLIDTYDTVEGARKAVKVAKDLERKGSRLLGVRLDSGDLSTLSKEVRHVLDSSGLTYVKLMASGDLDEYKINRLLKSGAQIDMFGVGTAMGTSPDAPVVNVNYKIVEVEGKEGEHRPVMKLSAEKKTLPGLKQINRVFKGDTFAYDVLSLEDEPIEDASPLIQKFVSNGKVLKRTSLGELRERVTANLEHLPEHLKALSPAEYPVKLSSGLVELSESISKQILKGDDVSFK